MCQQLSLPISHTEDPTLCGLPIGHPRSSDRAVSERPPSLKLSTGVTVCMRPRPKTNRSLSELNAEIPPILYGVPSGAGEWLRLVEYD